MRALCLIIALLFPALPLYAALEAPKEAPPQRPSLKAQLLVATPAMGDPRFHHAVILMIRHDRTGAMGVAINRVGEERTLASLMEAVGEKDAAGEGRVRIFVGGPVQPELGLVLHSPDYQRPGTVNIDGHVAMSASREILRDIGKGQGPRKSLIVFGYAGWAPGQLEGELARRDWFTASQDAQLVFDEDRANVWDRAMQRRTRDL